MGRKKTKGVKLNVQESSRACERVTEESMGLLISLNETPYQTQNRGERDRKQKGFSS